jgi:type II secretory pathway pseudopilin PulG
MNYRNYIIYKVIDRVKLGVSKGFTVVELALIIMIIGLMSAGITVASKKWLNSTYTQSDTIRLNNLALAFKNYFTLYGTLPCPARPNIASTDASEGVAQAGCFSSCPTGITCYSAKGTVAGAIPYITMNIPVDMTHDQYGNRYSYKVDSQFTNSNCKTAGNLIIQDINGNIITSQAFFALISYGPNGNGAYSYSSGSMKTCNTSLADSVNCSNGNTFRQAALVQSSNTNLIFDDVLSYGLNPKQQSCPSGATGCNLWLDSADTCAISLGTSPSVSGWIDKSVSGITLAQATSASMPTIQTTTSSYINNQSYLIFNTQFLSAASTSITSAITNTSAFTVTVVFRTTDTAAAIYSITNAATLTATPYVSLGLSGSGAASFFISPSNTISSGIYSNNNTYIMTATFDTANGMQLYINGKRVASGSAANTIPTFPNPSYIVIGGNSNWSNYVGNVMEVVNFSRSLSKIERINLEKNLASKWAIIY